MPRLILASGSGHSASRSRRTDAVGGAVGGAVRWRACPSPSSPRGARDADGARPPRPQDRPGARRDLPRRALRARLRRPLPAAGRHRAERPDHRQAGQRGPARRCSRPTPTPRAMAARRPREHLEPIIGPLGFFRAKTESLLKLQRRPGRAVRRRGAAAGSTTWSRCPASAARPPTSCSATPSASPGITVDTHFGRLARRLRLDRGDRPGQGRARGRRAVPQARLDDAQPPPDLARPPRSATPASPPAAPARWRAGARRTARARPTRRPPPSWSRPRAGHETARSPWPGGAAGRPVGVALASARRDPTRRCRRAGRRRHPRAARAKADGRGRPTARRDGTPVDGGLPA